MKTQNTNLNFYKSSIVELKQEDLLNVNGGSLGTSLLLMRIVDIF